MKLKLIISVSIILLILVLVPSKEAFCNDGWKSLSIGTQGACSSHGGLDRSYGLRGKLITLTLLCVWLIPSLFGSILKFIFSNKNNRKFEKIATVSENDNFSLKLNDAKSRWKTEVENNFCSICNSSYLVDVWYSGPRKGQINLRCSNKSCNVIKTVDNIGSNGQTYL